MSSHVAKAKIVEVNFGRSEVWADLESGEPVVLFSYDPKRFTLTPQDFIGLTREQAQRLVGQGPKKPIFTIDMSLARCPATSRGQGDIIGCGSPNLDGPDDEGLIDCLDCGIWFDPLREPSMRQALTIEGGDAALQSYLASLPGA